MANFPGLTAITSFGAGDNLLMGDSSDSDRSKQVLAKYLLTAVPFTGSSPNFVVNLASTVTNSIASDIHSCVILQGYDNVIGAASQVVGSAFTDPDFTGATANYSVSFGYDNLVNGQSNINFSNHSVMQGGSSHGVIMGGSLHELFGTSDYSGLFAGTNNTIDDSDWAAILGSNTAVITGSNGAAIVGGITSPSITSAQGAASIGGENSTISANFGITIGGQNSTASATSSVVIGAIGATSSGVGSAVLGSSLAQSAAAAGSVILGGTTGVSSTIAGADGSIILGGRTNSSYAPYSVTLGQDAVNRVRASLVQSADNLVSTADAQNVRWVGRGSGSGSINVVNTGTSYSNQEFGSYGATAGTWAGKLSLVYRKGTDYGYGEAEIQVSWPAGGTAVEEHFAWTWVNNPATLATPTLSESSNGGFYVVVNGGGSATQVVGTYDGQMTHW